MSCNFTLKASSQLDQFLNLPCDCDFFISELQASATCTYGECFHIPSCLYVGSLLAVVIEWIRYIADSQCEGNLICVAGVCDKNCTSDTDCATDQLCAFSQCLTKCSTTDDCKTSQVCADGFCTQYCQVSNFTKYLLHSKSQENRKETKLIFVFRTQTDVCAHLYLTRSVTVHIACFDVTMMWIVPLTHTV